MYVMNNLKNNEISFEFVKECRRELKKNFKGIESFSYGYCCNSDYYDGKPKSQINDYDYVNAKIYKGGLNNCFKNGKFNLGKIVYYNWELTNFNLIDVIKIMQQVADKYGYIVEQPVDKTKSIKVKIKEVA